MKRLILVLFAVLVATSAAQAQQKVTLAECGGDTVIYVKKNFVEGKARFIGQPFSKMLDEWRSQLPVGKILFSDTGNWPTKESERYLITGASLQFITEEEQLYREMRKEPYTDINVRFAPPYRHNLWALYNLRDQEGEPLGPQLYDCIRDYIVTDISFLDLK